MKFFFLDESQFELTNYSYADFDVIIKKFGYSREKEVMLHNYFDWHRIQHYSFKYDLYTEQELTDLFKRSIVYQENTFFIIRILHHHPLIKVSSHVLATMLDDLCYESGMGWEAISVDGKYVLEFTDAYEYLAKSNFLIHEH